MTVTGHNRRRRRARKRRRQQEKEQDQCQAITSSGEQCGNAAVWPEDDPEYCHLEAHKKQHESYESSDTEDQQEEDNGGEE